MSDHLNEQDTPTTLLVFGSEADALPLASALGCIEPAWGAVLAMESPMLVRLPRAACAMLPDDHAWLALGEH